MSNRTIALEIARQMGTRNRLAAMIGANHFVAIENGLQFSFKGSRKVNKCRVILDWSDTYTLELWKIQASSGESTLVASDTQVYGDQLIPIFEGHTGLYLTL